MKNHLIWLCLPAFFILVAPTQSGVKPGSIVGVVRFSGRVPPPEQMLTNDGIILHHDLVVDPKTKGLRYVVAVLEDVPAQPKATNTKPALMDQRGMLFVPRVIAVQHGQAVTFDNSDSCNHSVMANSGVEANQFNLIVPPGKPYEHLFEPQKHPVQISCSLHPSMRAWVYVFPHPWFAVSDEQGKFQIKEIPPGKYTLWLRHADTGSQQRRRFEVQSGKALELAIEWKWVEKK